MSSYKLLISIVSHGQLEFVNNLLSDLTLCNLDGCIIIVRSNIKENTEISAQNLDCIHVKNLRPAGFSCNHNRNFEMRKSKYFAVLNPDLKIIDPQIFQKLIGVMKSNAESLVCPSVVDSSGCLQDSARNFPKILETFKRLCFSKTKKVGGDAWEGMKKVDWCAGMFHLYPSSLFSKMNGFDEKYFLYCEDVDMGLRLKRNGFSTLVCGDILVEHNAQRDSHKSIKHFFYHLRSYIRLYFNIYMGTS